MITNKIDKNVKKIPLDKFVMCYVRQANDVLKQKYFDNNVKLIRDYIGVEEKKKIIENIIYDENGTLRSSIDRYIWFVLNIISNHTNINVNFSDIYTEFDLLNQNYLIEKIFLLIPEKQVNEFNKFLNMRYSDCTFNN